MALASLALTACHTKEYFENDGIPVEPEPEPEIVYEGEVNLEKANKDGDIAETNSTYTWKAEGNTITIDAFIDVMHTIAAEAKSDPELVKTAPHNTPIGRVDDVLAAKHPITTYWKSLEA
jgi:hypothetical protein